MILITIILSITVVILGYTTFNLLKKNELQEEILLSYLEYLTKISGIIDFSAKKIEEIDSKETFKSDDEIGFFFEQVKQIQDILNQFRIQ
jgi:Na+-transporting NADH:ubiquinone oxidoreductase subunit NqrE